MHRMRTGRIGLTSVEVTGISLGCAQLGNLGERLTDAGADALLRAAIRSGIRYFDTAPHYGRGLSELRLGRFLRETGFDARVSTKVGRVLTPTFPMTEADGFIAPLPNAAHFDYSARGIRASLAGSRDRLMRDHLDIVYVHDIGTATHGAAENARHLADLLDSGLPELERQKAAGRIGAIGLGVNEVDVCLDILSNAPLDAILLAGRWTLLDRSAEATPLAEMCRASGTSLVLGGVLNSGILATGPGPGARFDYAPASDEVQRMAAELERIAIAAGLTLAEAALAFAATRPGVASVLIGAGTPAMLARNLEALSRAPTREALDAMFRDAPSIRGRAGATH